MFIIMFIGAFIKRAGLITDQETKKFNKIVFIVCFPPMMFSNLYGRELEHAVDLRLIGFAVAVVLGMYALTVLFVLKIERSQKTRGAMIQAIYRSNFVIMGIPVVQNVFGKGDLAVTAMMVTIIVPLYNVIAVLTLEVFRGSKPNVKDILKNLAKNPILIGAVSGVIAILTGLKLPLALETPINMLGEAASPLAACPEPAVDCKDKKSADCHHNGVESEFLILKEYLDALASESVVKIEIDACDIHKDYQYDLDLNRETGCIIVVICESACCDCAECSSYGVEPAHIRYFQKKDENSGKDHIYQIKLLCCICELGSKFAFIRSRSFRIGCELSSDSP